MKAQGKNLGYMNSNMFHTPRVLPNHFYMVVIAIMVTCSVVSSLNDSNDLFLSLAEMKALQKFKSQVIKKLPEKFMKTDFYLIRWLRGSNFDVDRAQNLLLQTVQWRLKNNLTNILAEDWADMDLDYKMSHDGIDKEGRPILSIDVGDWDLRAATLRGITRRVQRYFTYSSEKSMHRVFEEQAAGKSVTRYIVLVDADGLNLPQHLCPSCLAILMYWANVRETHYPLFTDEAVVINAPSISFVMNALRPILSSSIRGQMKVFNTNRQEWMAYLDKIIDKNQRRKRYGGTL